MALVSFNCSVIPLVAFWDLILMFIYLVIAHTVVFFHEVLLLLLLSSYVYFSVYVCVLVSVYRQGKGWDCLFQTFTKFSVLNLYLVTCSF